MTSSQQQRIERAWARLRSTTERVRRAGEAIKSASLSGASAERLQELSRLYDEAVKADTEAQDELEAAMRDAGWNV